MAGDVDTSRAVGDVGSLEGEAGKVGPSAATVHDEVSRDDGLSAFVIKRDLVPVAGRTNGVDLATATDFDPDVDAAGDEQFDEVGIEAAKRAGAVIDDDGLRAGAGRDVGELERDEPAADDKIRGGSRSRYKNAVESMR